MSVLDALDGIPDHTKPKPYENVAAAVVDLIKLRRAGATQETLLREAYPRWEAMENRAKRDHKRRFATLISTLDAISPNVERAALMRSVVWI